jgi:hypothetical protein
MGRWWAAPLIGLMMVLAACESVDERSPTTLVPIEPTVASSTSLTTVSLTTVPVSTSKTVEVVGLPESIWDGVYVLDDTWRNPKEWSEDDPRIPPDGFVPISVVYDSDGFPIVAYWVGLAAALPLEEGESLPEDIEAALYLGSVRLAFCRDSRCQGGADIVEIGEVYWPGGIDLALLPDGSPVITISGDTSVWDAEAGPNGKELAEPTRVVICSDPRCDSATVHEFEDLITEYPTRPHVEVPTPQVAVTSEGVLVFAYPAGLDPDEQSLVLLTCGNRDCTEGNTSVAIDDPKAWRIDDMWLDPVGNIAVRYGNRVVVCHEPRCEPPPEPTDLPTHANDLLAVDNQGSLWIWRRPTTEDGTVELMRCSDATCADAHFAPTDLDLPADNWSEFPEPCRIIVSVGPDENSTFTWCEFGDAETEAEDLASPRTVVACADSECLATSRYDITNVDDITAMMFASIIYDRGSEPSLILGGDGALLLQPIDTHP